MRVLVDTFSLCVHHSASSNASGLWEFSINIMQFLDSIIAKARANRQSIVLAEGEDIRVIEAAERAQHEGIADCILLGREAEILQQADILDLDLSAIRIEDPAASQYHERYSRLLWEVRQHKGMTRQQAELQVQDPLCFADLMLYAGDTGGSIAGAIYTTGDRVRSALQIIGVKPGFKTVSSFMLMLFEAEHHHPKQVMLLADCALMVDPDATQLAEIAVATVQSAHQFLEDDVRVAMLSFSTDGSASHPLVDKVREATRLARKQIPGTAIEGEVQLDAAIVPAVARQKIANSQIAGRANVLIFPGLEAANIGYKMAQRLGAATAIGPILQGLNHPANDLSRGCSSEDVYNLIALTAVQAAG